MNVRTSICILLLAGASIGRVADAARTATSQVIGNGTPASCTEAALNAALLSGGAITFDCGPNPHSIMFSARKTIGANTNIDGGGKVTFDAGGASGHFLISPSKSLAISRLRLVNAAVNSSIQMGDGALSLEDSEFSNNTRGVIFGLTPTAVITVTRSRFLTNTHATGLGGAIYNTGRLTISNSSFVGNSAPMSQEGGAIYNSGGASSLGQIVIMRSSFEGNSAGYGGTISNYGVLTMTESAVIGSASTFNGGGGGGAIYQNPTGRLRLTNVTISGGQAQPNNKGAALYVSGNVSSNGATTLTNVTIADNTGGTSQVFVANLGVLELRNTIIVNGACAKDAGATVTDNTGNYAFGAAGCPGLTNDPQLMPLAYYGGPTKTRALPNTSPARNGGTNIGCPSIDQRGVLRPQQVCDSGAFENNSTPVFGAVNPATVCAGSGDTTFAFTGANFIDGPFGTEAVLSGTALSTRYLSPTLLTAVVPAAALAAPAHTLTFTLRVPIPDLGPTGVSAAQQYVNVVVCNDPIIGLTAGNNGPTPLGSATQLTASVTGGGGVSYVWNFGDGQMGAGQSPTHTYGAVGSYVATVTATNNIGIAVAQTTVNVNLVTTGKLISTLHSDFSAVITYTYIVTHIAPPGSPVASVTISGSVPQNTALVSVSGATHVPSGGDYGNGFVKSAPDLPLQPGQSATVVWVVRSTVPVGDVVTQAHAITDDGRMQVFERDRVFRSLLMLVCKGCVPTVP